MKRTPFKRVPASDLRRGKSVSKCEAPTAPTAPEPKRRTRKCALKTCRKVFEPRSMTHKACCPECALALAADERERNDRKAAADGRADTKRRLAEMKTIPQLKAELQTIFNRYIRARDMAAGHGCICCGKFATAAALAQPGGAYDACHYRSRGSADHLRFDERNVHLGLKSCNMWGHHDYRGGLIQRIGLADVDALESDQTVVKWTREVLLELIEKYKRKLRELKENNYGN